MSEAAQEVLDLKGETPPAAGTAAEGEPTLQNTGNEAPPAQAPEGEKPAQAPEVTPEQAAKREGRRFERRLDKAYRQRAEAQARAEAAERRAQELEQKFAATRQGADGSEPRLEQYDDIEKYATAKAEYARAKTEKEFAARQAAEANRRYAAQIASEWERKVEKAQERHEDFDAVVGELKPVNEVALAIMEEENGTDIIYHLMTEKKEFARIAALPVRAQIREIGKLSAKLAAEALKAKTPSKAPAPIATVGGKAGGANELPSDSDDIETWMRKENARMKKMAGA